MNRDEWTRAAALYLPIVFALLAGLSRPGLRQPRRPRQFAACLLSVLWAFPSLLIVQRLNQSAGWWTFSSTGVLFRAMPLELYLGWVDLWGLVPQLALPKLRVAWCFAIMVAADLAAMPLCGPTLKLNAAWLVGESVAALLVLLPALSIARGTLLDSHLPLRAAIQIATSGMLFLFLLPELIFALRPGLNWSPLLNLPSWGRQLALQAMALLAIPGVSAVLEFAERGLGTPIPYDPPRRLVTSGIYRYCANPMQLSCGLVMLAWAVSLRNGWLGAAAAISIVYSAGIAKWDESEDLARRFGNDWKRYRAAVHNWLPRWTPYHAGPEARVYIAGTCGPCSELRTWIEARKPLGLQLVAAEELPSGSIRRIRYNPGDGSPSVEGVRALGRALEHLNLGWALAGAVLRLPVVWQAVQLLTDASGLGPRTLPELSAK